MTYYDYKVVPAPSRMKKVRGVKTSDELFALTLTDAINDHARQGWEYVRAESLTAETPAGWLRRGRSEPHTVLVFRQERGTLGPRLAASHEAPPASAPAAPVARRAEARPEPRVEPAAPAPQVSERPFVDRLQASLARREPAVDAAGSDTPAATPLRTAPRLGPADRS